MGVGERDAIWTRRKPEPRPVSGARRCACRSSRAHPSGACGPGGRGRRRRTWGRQVDHRRRACRPTQIGRANGREVDDRLVSPASLRPDTNVGHAPLPATMRTRTTSMHFGHSCSTRSSSALRLRRPAPSTTRQMQFLRSSPQICHELPRSSSTDCSSSVSSWPATSTS